MKVLITGVTGFIGSNLKQRLVSLGHEVHGHHRGTDLCHQLETLQPDLILHCAAEIYDLDAMHQSNVIMTWHCIDHVRRHRCSMIYFGSSSEYGWRDCVTSEGTAIEPHTAYAGTKAAGTYLCQGWARELGLDIVTMRLYSIYGPGERPHRLFPRLWLAFKLDRGMDLVDGVHDFVYIDDAVDAVMCVINSDRRGPGEIINVCSGVQTTNHTVLQTFEHVTARQAPVRFDADKFVTQPRWQGDPSHLRTKYCWAPRFDLNTGIADFLDRAHYE